jgi:hypothetical protein
MQSSNSSKAEWDYLISWSIAWQDPLTHDLASIIVHSC